jgi:hypothetical protein
MVRRDRDVALPPLVRTGRRRPAKREGSAASIEDQPGIRSTLYVFGTTWLADERACRLLPGWRYSSLFLSAGVVPSLTAKTRDFLPEPIRAAVVPSSFRLFVI